MKKIKLFIYLFVATLVFSQTTFSSSIIEIIKQGVFKFETETNDYGTIEQNSDGYRAFIFTNTGEAPIVITKVKGSCGCTVPTKPDEPILPEETAEIKVKYATKNIGSFNKKVSIYSNAFEPIKIVSIKGKVVKSSIGENKIPEPIVRKQN